MSRDVALTVPGAYVALDLETTGLAPRQDEIIEVGAIKFRGDQVLDTFTSLTKPRKAPPRAIQLLTGITSYDLRDAPPFAAIAGDLLLFLEGCTLVGQNASFDIAFLAQQGLELPHPVYDTLELAKILAPYLPERNLTALTDYFDVAYPIKHRALPDATAAKDVFLALQQRAMGLDMRVLASLGNLGANTGWNLAGFFRGILDRKLIESLEASGQANRPPPRAQEQRSIPAAEKPREGEPAAARPDGPRTRTPVDVALLNRLLEPDGPLARSFPGFERRPEQTAMMQAVAAAFNDSDHLIVEAGTGTGKSLAYLLPALFYAVQNDTSVVISTNTIALQEQITQKDAPMLLRMLEVGSGETGADGFPPIEQVKIEQLKGRGNYLCPRRWLALSGATAPTIDAGLLARITVWLATTETGDRAELNLNNTELSAWNRLSAQAENCPATQCMQARSRDCFLQKARQRAAEAHVLVVNHALLVSDFNAGNKVLPEYEYLVIDEAHHLEDVATDQLGFRTGPGEYLEFLDRLSQDGAGRQQGALPNLEAAVSSGGPLFALHNQVLQHVAALKAELTPARNRVGHLFSLLADYLRQHGQGSAEYSRRVRLTGGARRQPLWSPVEQAWEDAQLTFQAIQRHLEHLHTSMEDSTGSTIDEYDDRITEIEGLHFTCQQLLDRGNAVIAHADPECVTWLATTGQSDGVGLFAAPIEVGPALNRELFSKKTSVILTSATLRTGDDFEYIKGRLGLEMPRELAVDSSFPYRDAALLLATLDLPEPHRPDHAMMLEQALGDLCVASQGRALVLFTSHAALQSAYRTLKQLLEPQSITVLAQGMSGNTQRMLERLRAQPQTVLLGTNSLWEGIDVVGEALSLLVITRLPFSVPTDPVFAARSERFEDPFREYAVPQAVLRFRQGFGRLIRSKTDRGVAVVLDPRASSKNYGAAFFQPLPPVTVRRCALREAPKMVAQWLAPAKG